jgi:hypothetical protein
MLILSMGSCQFATFDARPGVLVKTYPKEIQGTWQSVEKHKGVRDTHNLVVTEKGVKIDATTEKMLNLSDTDNTLSHLGDFYFLNIREQDSTGKAYYTVYPFEFDEKHLYFYILSVGKTQKKLNKLLKHASSKVGHYQMDNEVFKNYCEKHLKRRKAMKLTRIK